MKEVKKLILRVLLVIEVIGFAGWYMISARGLRALKNSENQNKQLLNSVKDLEKEITLLKEEIDEREKDPFYKEKIAREELQMAREDEEIYLLPK